MKAVGGEATTYEAEPRIIPRLRKGQGGLRSISIGALDRLYGSTCANRRLRMKAPSTWRATSPNPPFLRGGMARGCAPAPGTAACKQIIPLLCLGFAVLALLTSPHSAAAQRFATGGPYNAPAGASPTAELLRDVGIEQHLDQQLPLDAEFVDETGRRVRLGDYFSDKPVVLALVYYKCPMLCTQVLNGFLKSSQAVSLEMGRDFKVVTVSFDPGEGPELAAQKKKQYVRAYRRDGADRGWHFLTGDRESIERLTQAVGFRYRYDPPSGQFGARQRHCDRDTPGAAGPISVRHRIFAARSAAGTRRKLGRPDRLACRPGAVALLPLRPADRPVWPGNRQRAAWRGHLDRTRVGIFPGGHVPPRTAPPEADESPSMIEDGFRLLPEQASTHAPRVDLLYYALIGLSALITTGVAAVIIYFSIKYRRGNNTVDRTPGPLSILSVEVVWTVIPLLISLLLFGWGATLYFTAFRPPAGAMEIRVVAKQWMWKFQHGNGRREINTLHVPLGRPVKLTMISEDVIHSFFVPAFRVKQDVLPGRYSGCWFEATRTGDFHLFCAEYCGTNHSLMTGSVVVMEPIEYEIWLGGGHAHELPVAAGKRLFEELRCANCHMPVEPLVRCPPLQNLYGHEVLLTNDRTVVADEDYLARVDFATGRVGREGI